MSDVYKKYQVMSSMSLSYKYSMYPDWLGRES